MITKLIYSQLILSINKVEIIEIYDNLNWIKAEKECTLAVKESDFYSNEKE